jgi:hypothetical protein
VGNGGTILTSSDGIAWTKQTTETVTTLNEIIYVNNTFVFVGGIILTSPDGITRTKQTSQIANILNIVHANNVFVTVGYYGTIGVCNYAMRISLA